MSKPKPLALHATMKAAAAVPLPKKIRREPIDGRRGPQASRIGKAPITVFLEPQVRRQLKMLAAEQDTTVQELFARAVNALFAEFKKGEIALTKV